MVNVLGTMVTATTGQLSTQVDFRHGRESPHRDQELVHFIGRCGVVSIAHVMVALSVCRASPYRRVATLIEAGLRHRLDLLPA